MYTLYQQDFTEAADPLSMFWYNPQVTGGWYMGLPLDTNFSNTESPWVSMRSSWTDTTGLFVAMKAGPAVGHQTRKYRPIPTTNLFYQFLCINGYFYN